ncbi:MAG: hypothetical protein CMM60_05265 [Rhodospirillaceae bacterium]|nr:hypothetical protein [Rhodospirillaceae bacterium]
MKKISIFIFIISFLIYRPYRLQDSGLKYEGDDDGYFAHAASIAFLQFPSYDKEYGSHSKYPIGAGMLASPFVFLFSQVDRLSGSDIVHSRLNSDVNIKSWSLFGFVFSSIFYFWMSCLIAYKTLRIYYDEKYSVLSILLMILIQGIPLYVYRRPMFAHVYEFFAQTVMVYLMVLSCNSKKTDGSVSRLLLICLTVYAIGLIRYNNVLIALCWPLAAFAVRDGEWKLMENRKPIILSYIICALPILIGIVISIIKGMGPEKWLFYSENFYQLLNKAMSLPFTYYVKRIIHVIFGVDWGLAYTAPFLIVGIVSIINFKSAYIKMFVIPLIPVMISFYLIVMAWSSQASWYGYRYIIFVILPLMILPLADALKRAEDNIGKKIYVAVAIVSLFPLISMLCFEGNPTTLTLHETPSGPFRGPAIDNLTYQLEVWKTLLFDPVGFIIVIFKGGLLYFVYLITLLTNTTYLLPDIVLEKYPVFDLVVLIKSLIIYSAPFAFYAIHKSIDYWPSVNDSIAEADHLN